MIKLCADTCGVKVASAVVCQWRKSLEGRGESREKKEGRKADLLQVLSVCLSVLCICDLCAWACIYVIFICALCVCAC